MPRGPRRQTHGLAKLTPDQVRAIRASAEPVALLARQYGMSTGAIRHIRVGRSWAYIDDADRVACLTPQVLPQLPDGTLALRLFDGQLAVIDAEDAPLVTGRFWFLEGGRCSQRDVVSGVDPLDTGAYRR